jgi:hypothetical protein
MRFSAAGVDRAADTSSGWGRAAGHEPMEAFSDLPMSHDMDADYSPQYVKLARMVRDKIKADEYKHLALLPAREYDMSIRVASVALAMLAANRYVSRSGGFASYRVT